MEYFEKLKSPIMYHIKLDGYVKNLKRSRDELNSKIEDMEQQLEIQLRHAGKVPKKAVENWLKYGKEKIDEAQGVENEVNNVRYHGRAVLAKRVEEKTQEMQDILNKCPNESDGLVIDDPNVGLPLPTSELIGEKDVRDQIWSWLMQEEVFRIGVWGMGGVGKTTILKHIHNDLVEKKRFDKVIWVTISQEFNIVKLQDDIAEQLGEVLSGGDKVRRAALLMNMLKKAKKHVLILDDVWDKISLEEVGIPEPNRSNGSKLVLTTRKEEVCKFLSCQVIQVFPLKEEEALTLFLNKVGLNISQISTFESTLRLVVKECAGLPLTIVVVAGTLKVEYDPRIWNNALNELKRRIGEVEGVEAEVIGCLKFSFDQLKDKNVQHCFLYCALYPEDYTIEEDSLIEYWIDEGFIAEMDTRQEMKDKGHAILKKLKDNCLLESVNIHFSDGMFVKMHDAVRDMALSNINMKSRCMIKAGMLLERFPEEEEWATNVEKVTLMWNSISEIPIDLTPPKCPLLTTMLLKHNPIKRIPNSFFANMPSLSVLDLSFTEIECLPTSISELKNLTTLLLVECGRLKHLPSLSELQGLKKLDLSYSPIEEVPEGMEMLVNLRYLDLSGSRLKELPTGLLAKLSRLQHLTYNGRSERIAEEAEQLEKLECYFGDSLKDVHQLKKFVQKGLNAYFLSVGPRNYFTRKGKTVSICAQFCGDEVLLPIDIQLFTVKKCDLLRSLSDISSLKDAVDLRQCIIDECQGIEFVISFSFSISCTRFQSLENLMLLCLPRLSGLVKAEGFASGSPILDPPGIFSHLKQLHVVECSNIKKLFLHWLLTDLQNLEEILVNDCKQLVEIFAVAEPDDDDEEKGSTDKIKVNLPKLRWLTVYSLPNLKSISSTSGVMVCDSFEFLRVINCSKLKRIPQFVSPLGNKQPYAYAPPSLEIYSSREWWDSLEWDHPNFKNVLQPLCKWL